jgi:dihydroneopterin aldolase
MLKIEIRDYPVFMKLGYRSEERYKSQNVLVSLKITVDDSADPGLTDNLEQALDYGQVTELIESILADQEYKLIETVVHLVGQRVMEKFRCVSQVRVTVEKTCLPQSQMKTSRVKISQEFDRKGS